MKMAFKLAGSNVITT